MPDIDPAFGHWFAGFAAGEGCFEIPHGHNRKKEHEGFGCRFSIRLRRDDRAILEEIRDTLGIGQVGDMSRTIYPVGHKNFSNTNPTSRFIVNNKVNCPILRDIFLAYPLRAKKAADFEIWSEGLDYWLAHERGTSWDNMADVKKRLEEVRKYKMEDK